MELANAAGKRILFYNWTHIDEKIGGGVNVYQKNLALAMVNEGYDVYYLNAGLSYDKAGDVRLVEYENSLDKRIKCYEIINSPVLAPVMQSPKNIQQYLNDQSVKLLVKKLILQIGNISVVHFNNLEGLPVSVLSLKEEFPEIKFVYSLHNYFPLCNRVDLWKHDNKGGCNCAEHTDLDCAQCYNWKNYTIERAYRRRDISFSGRVIRKCRYLYSKLSPDNVDISLYTKFTVSTIEAINKYMDVMLAVSGRVAEIYASQGLDMRKVKISYIGTKVAEFQADTSVTDVYSSPFKLIYMGYMNKPKGFFFFVDVLKHMPDDMASKLEITIVARYSDEHKSILEELQALRHRFVDIKLVNGYTHDNQYDLLKDKHLGIVPVLWEDNLPQVAIEQVAYGVPILASDLGGACEIFSKNEHFVFQAGDVNECISKIRFLLENRRLLLDFWDDKIKFKTLEEHINEITDIYRM